MTKHATTGEVHVGRVLLLFQEGEEGDTEKEKHRPSSDIFE